MTYPYPKHAARMETGTDLSPLFSLINGTVIGAKYFDVPERIQFVFEGAVCTVYPFEIIAGAFNDHDHATAFAENLLRFLNDLYTRRDSIKPDFRKVTRLSVLDLYKILPQSNCGECGLPSCLAFAGALSKGAASINQCPGAAQPIEGKAVYAVVDGEGRLVRTVELGLPTTDIPPGNRAGKLEAILTGREVEVLKFMAMGATNTEIAEHLFVSPHTVKTHVVHIYEKLGVNDRTQAAVIAARHHLI